jgi:hypothetical protein
MSEELETILRLVAEGTLSPAEAAPIIDALTAARTRHAVPPEPPANPSANPRVAIEGKGRKVRIQVSERGRRVVDLRVPLAFAAFAAAAVPGIPDSYAALISQAVESDTTGTIVDAEDENGDGVLISLE